MKRETFPFSCANRSLATANLTVYWEKFHDEFAPCSSRILLGSRTSIWDGNAALHLSRTFADSRGVAHGRRESDRNVVNGANQTIISIYSHARPGSADWTGFYFDRSNRYAVECWVRIEISKKQMPQVAKAPGGMTVWGRLVR